MKIIKKTPPQRYTPKKILIVEDTESTRMTLAAIARTQGYDVTECQDAESGLTSYAEKHHTIALIDWLLPGMNGLELCRKIRQAPFGSKTVIIVLTSKNTSEDLMAVLKAGADDYMPKQIGLGLINIRLKIAERQLLGRLQRKNAEIALRRSEKEYRDIINNASGIILHVDSNGKIVFANRFAEKIFLYKKEELIGRNLIGSLIPKKEIAGQEILNSINDPSINPDYSDNREIGCIRKDGRRIYISWSSRAVRNAAGNVTGIISLGQDITEKKIAQEKALRMQSELDQIFNNATDGMVVINKDYKISRINKTLIDMLDLDTKGVAGKPCFEIFSTTTCHDCPQKEDSTGRLFCPIIEKTLAGKIKKHHEERILTSQNGRQMSCILTTTPFFNKSGQPIGILRSFRDITDRKLAEEKYMSFFEKSQDLVFVASGDGKIIEINPAGLDFLGFASKDEIEDKTLFDFFSSSQDINSLLDNLAKRGSVKDFETILKKPDGAEAFALITMNASKGNNGRIAECTGIIKDITERIKNEQQIMKMNIDVTLADEKLKATQSRLVQQEKLASIGELAAGVAHEINNPLGFIKSNFVSLKNYLKVLTDYQSSSEKVINQIMEIDTQEAEKVLQNLELTKKNKKIDFILEDIEDLFSESLDGFNRIMSIIQNLKTFARIDNVNGISKFDLNKAIENTLIIARNEIKYHAEVEKDLSDIPQISGRQDEINQVLLNIIVNATQAIKNQNRSDQGLISIKTSTNGDYILCEITDNGPGMNAATKAKIFDPFFTTKEEGKGTGLGLSISYDIIVNKHDGDLTVRSEVGKGTTFLISLPIEHSVRE